MYLDRHTRQVHRYRVHPCLHTRPHTHSNLRRGFAASTRDAVKSLHDRANTPTRNTSGRAPRTALQVSHQVPAPPVPPPPQFFRAQLARQEPHRQRVVGQRCDAQVRCRVNRRLRPLAAADEAVRDLCVCVCVCVCVCAWQDASGLFPLHRGTTWLDANGTPLRAKCSCARASSVGP